MGTSPIFLTINNSFEHVWLSLPAITVIFILVTELKKQMNQKTLFFKQLRKTKPAVQTREIKNQELLLEIHKGFFLKLPLKWNYFLLVYFIFIRKCKGEVKRKRSIILLKERIWNWAKLCAPLYIVL